jgi:hypothetical protein
MGWNFMHIDTEPFYTDLINTRYTVPSPPHWTNVVILDLEAIDNYDLAATSRDMSILFNEYITPLIEAYFAN